MNHNGNNIEARLGTAADELRANSKLKSSGYSVAVLGLVSLRYADHKFQALARELLVNLKAGKLVAGLGEASAGPRGGAGDHREGLGPRSAESLHAGVVRGED